MAEEQVQEVRKGQGMSDTTQRMRRAAPSKSPEPDVPSSEAAAAEVKAAKSKQLGRMRN